MLLLLPLLRCLHNGPSMSIEEYENLAHGIPFGGTYTYRRDVGGKVLKTEG